MPLFSNDRPITPPKMGGSTFPRTGSLCGTKSDSAPKSPKGSSGGSSSGSGSVSKLCSMAKKNPAKKTKPSSNSQDGSSKKARQYKASNTVKHIWCLTVDRNIIEIYPGQMIS
ncbi:hypothetical protein PHYBLDRAFT_170112 [Phycomyces blakesleeanus NRRL 1555(-)]|uniref:Uncharacterized protein n=1 Tax=Phycomyces blakesleeanus (strain ATCC 8743b / DSM 1359 / FGSC 10004 / NBRC 33097 / NRRL 1555) TaxID=763407 RepID=A0A163AAW4_PHYB8|nr:hypothetical protein PHYBLDRAFT_170112 [Phycomyces blakesleeanus NRRL 1555(-)]OAD72221.1 hypothetical protein PHYBLDRAFT_170112 [Phycomyces blakesleeanus NRRL 1555(-)]|eukprot:XP_018290261.1 hypothetical protein PHYBLDRAFT_170112 [Phycomyces blakesleeanus NRRL 1555(-)]